MAERNLTTVLRADDSGLTRALEGVADHARKAGRELDGALGKSLKGATQDMSKLGSTAPGVAAAMLRLESAQDRYNRALQKTGPESAHARAALASVAEQQDKLRVATERATLVTSASNRAASDGVKHHGMFAKVMESAKGTVWGYVAAVGVGGLVTVMGKTVEAASNLNEQISKNSAVFKESQGTVLEWSRHTADSIAISQRAALEASGTFGNMLIPMGLARKEAAGMSTHLVTLAADLASFNNTSTDDALEALRSGLAGESEPLRKFGVFLSADRIQAEALALGLGKATKSTTDVTAAQHKLEAAHAKAEAATNKYGSASLQAKLATDEQAKAEESLHKALQGKMQPLSQAAKAQATYKLILKDTTDAQGDMQRTGSSLANQQRKMQAKWEDLSAQIGKVFLPVMVKVIGIINDAAGALMRFFGIGPTGTDMWKQDVAKYRKQAQQAAAAQLPSTTTSYGGGMRASGGYIMGDPRLGDVIPTWLTGGEVVLNQAQQNLVGHTHINRALSQTGGVMGGNRFASGGIVAAQSWMSGHYGDRYDQGARLGPHSWDCSGAAGYIASLIPGYSGGVGGTTYSYWPMVSGKRAGQPGKDQVLWGFSHFGADGKNGPGHMFINVGGKVFNAHGKSVNPNIDGTPSPGAVYRVPPGLDGVSEGSAANQGADSISYTGAGSSMSLTQFNASGLARGGRATPPGLTDIASVTRRHADDSLQQRAMQAHGASQAQILTVEQTELQRDVQDYDKAIAGVTDQITKRLKARNALIAKARNPRLGAAARGRLAEQITSLNEEITNLRDARITLRQARSEAVQQAKILGFDIQDAITSDAQAAADATVGGGFTDEQTAALSTVADFTGKALDFGNASSGMGIGSSGGGWDSVYGPAGNNVTVNIQALHPSDPSVLQSINNVVTRALGTTGGIPATLVPSGA